MKIKKIRTILIGLLILGVASVTHLGAGWAVGQATSQVAPGIALKKACIDAAIRGIELEIARCQSWIDLREQKQVNDPDSLPGLKSALKTLKADLQRYQAMNPEEYGLPEKVQTNAWVDDNPGVNSILHVDGMSKSGPWYHLTGIVGNDYTVLKPNAKYKVTFYKVYGRSYFNMSSTYVYIADYKNSADLAKQYPLKYKTYRVNQRKPMRLTRAGYRKIQLIADITDGGGITGETMMVKNVENSPGNVTVVDLLYTVDGQPTKAFFTRELKAVLKVPASGRYRIKLWMNELFHQTGEVLVGEMEIQVK